MNRNMGVGRGWGSREPRPTLDFDNSSKKGCFLNLDCEKPNFTTFGPPGKILEKYPSPPLPWKKSFRSP